jgi:hypothetical protein
VHGSKRWRSGSRRSGRFLLPVTLTVLAVSAMLSSGCGRSNVIPDPNIPHQVASETCVDVWVRRESGNMEKVKVRLLEGWWVASPQVVDPPPK